MISIAGIKFTRDESNGAVKISIDDGNGYVHIITLYDDELSDGDSFTFRSHHLKGYLSENKK